MRVIELSPGIGLDGERLVFCPGCGVEAIGGDPTDPEQIADWCIAAFAVIRTAGATGFTMERAMQLAARYLKGPWHDSR